MPGSLASDEASKLGHSPCHRRPGDSAARARDKTHSISPWAARDGWRMNRRLPQDADFLARRDDLSVESSTSRSGYRIAWRTAFECEAHGRIDGRTAMPPLNGMRIRAAVLRTQGRASCLSRRLARCALQLQRPSRMWKRSSTPARAACWRPCRGA